MHEPNEVIKMSSHHQGFGRPINESDDPVLHRFVLASHGRKLYEFVSYACGKENEQGCAQWICSVFLSDTFPGLRALHERGIMHGDISLGNLFLGTTEGIPGFVGDLDPAKVDPEMIKASSPDWYDEVESSKRGALRTVSLV